MPDIAHWWGNDLTVTSSGDIETVDGTTRGEQRIVRRLMTAGDRRDSEGTAQPGEYVAHPDYGGSVPQRIGDNIDEAMIEAMVRSQITKEEAVARIPPAAIAVSPYLDGVTVGITYVDAKTGAQKSLSFDAGN